MSAVSPVRFTTTSLKPLASRRSSVADSFSTSSVISTMLWTALWRSVSERLVLLMISFKVSLFWERICSRSILAWAMYVDAPARTASPGVSVTVRDESPAVPASTSSVMSVSRLEMSFKTVLASAVVPSAFSFVDRVLSA